MALFSKKYIEEAYKSKYASYLDDDKDNDDDEDEEEDKKSDNKKQESINRHLTRSEIHNGVNALMFELRNYPKLKRCCDIIDLSDKDDLDDDGERTSSFDRYYNGPINGAIKVIEGDVFTGYPGSKGQEEYDNDVTTFLKNLNKAMVERGLPIKVSKGREGDDDSVSFVFRGV